MKKYFIFLCMLVFAVFLTSCGKKTELKPFEVNGDELTINDINILDESFNMYHERLDTKDKLYDEWYSIKIESIENKETEEESLYSYIKVSGNLYESSYTFDTKMKLTIKIEAENIDKESEITQKISGKISVIYIKGNCYVKVDAKSTTKGDFEKKTLKIKETIICDISEFNDLLSIDLDLVSTSYSAISSFIKLVLADGLKSSKVYKNNDTYYYVNESQFNGRESYDALKIEFNKQYELNNMSSFSSSIYSNDERNESSYMKTEIKESLGALIHKPLNSSDYLEGSIEDIFNELLH